MNARGALIAAMLFVVAERANAHATFTGVVVDSLNAPLSGAEVTLPQLSRLAITDAKGSFVLTGIPAGDQQVAVRRVGYAPLETKISFTAAGTTDRKLVMRRV